MLLENTRNGIVRLVFRLLAHLTTVCSTVLVEKTITICLSVFGVKKIYALKSTQFEVYTI